MPNPAKQLERHSWAAGYADGYIDGLEEAWARINAALERGPCRNERKMNIAMDFSLRASLLRPQAGEVPTQSQALRIATRNFSFAPVQ